MTQQKYFTEEEIKKANREKALRYYYKNKATLNKKRVEKIKEKRKKEKEMQQKSE